MAGVESQKINTDGMESIEDIGTTAVTEPAETIGYTNQLNDITLLLVLIIFFIGVISGLIAGKIMWERVR